MKLSPLLAVLVPTAAAVLADTSLAAQTAPRSFHSSVSALDPANGDVNEIAWAECTQDSTLDAALLQDGVLVVAVNPGYAESSLPVSGDFEDVVGWSEDGTRLGQRLVAVGVDGLQQIRWDTASGAFVKTDLFPAGSAGATLWDGALRVEVANLGTGGDQDLIGIASDGQTILTAEWTGTAFVANSFTQTVTGTVLDIAAADSQADGSDDVVVLTTTELRTFDTLGRTVGVPVNLASNRGGLTTVERTAGPVEGVAWLRRNGTTWALYMVDLTLGVPAQTLAVNTLNPRRVTGGDYFGNGRTDLAITNGTGTIVRVLRQSPAGTFSLAPAERDNVIVSNPPTGATTAPSTFCDVDNDGDLDLLYPNAEDPAIFVGRNDRIDHFSTAPRFLATTNAPDQEQIWRTTTGDFPVWNLTDVHARFEAPAFAGGSTPPINATHTAPGDADHLEVRLWHSKHLGSGVYQTEAQAIATELIPLGLFTEVQPEGIAFLQADLSVNVTVDEEDLLYVTPRYVKLQGGDIVNSWAHDGRYMVNIGENVPVQHVVDFFFAGGLDLEFKSDQDPWTILLGGGETGTQSGGGGSIGCVPEMPPGIPPVEDEPDPKTEAPAQPDKS